MRKMCIRCGLLAKEIYTIFVYPIAWLCNVCEEEIHPDYETLWVDLGGEGGGA